MSIQHQLVRTLAEQNLKIATAESCTGGLIAELITDIPGASEVFECGVCSYSNRIKSSVLGVSEETLAEFTELSLKTAEEMAVGVLKLSGADIAVSTTGIAGPGGGTEENPVGTVYVALATKNSVQSRKINFNPEGSASRSEIRRRCAEYCLKAAFRASAGLAPG